MLEGLFGNKNVQKILIFLFVNGKCYGSQLQRLLHTPLTPLQQAFSRLEKGGIIMSTYEGKTRLYQFNPAFPMLAELELLLKKTYTLLSPQEKKKYYYVDNVEQIPGKNDYALLTAWERLSKVKQLMFNAKTKSQDDGGWNGKGRGEVLITKENGKVLIFNEKGSWQDRRSGQEITFSNVFRWTLDRAAGVISLEHLRRGANHPVFLFHLAPTGDHSLSSVDSHLCEGDVYLGRILYDQQCLRFNWRVIGPKKNEEIDYYYT